MAKLPLEFHPEARVDALEAYQWYDQRSEYAADAFQEELQTAGSAIQKSPELWGGYLFGTRGYLMKRFPFVVVYRKSSDRIEIIAVAHGHRSPGYWKNRLDSV